MASENSYKHNTHIEVVRLLISLMKDNSDFLEYALRISCMHGHYQISKLLIEDLNVDFTCWNHRPLSFAKQYKHFTIVRLLNKHYKVLDISSLAA